jgi:hypothetical protein
MTDRPTRKSKRRIFLLAVASASIAGPRAVFAQDKPPAATLATNPRGVYASIDLRPADEMVRRLGAATGGDRRAAVREVIKDPSAHMPPVLYALANALAEDRPEDAIYWYHLGRMRAVYDGLRCKDKSAQAALIVLRTRLSYELRVSLFYQRSSLVAIAQKAIDFDAKNPPKYDHRWISLYGTVAATSDGANPDEVSVPVSEWPAILKRVHEAHLKSVQDFAAKKS